MNNQKQDWMQLIKASSTHKGVFTEKMKQTVIHRVEQNKRKRNNSWFFYTAAPLIILMMCISILSFVNHLPELFNSSRGVDTNAAVGLEAISKDEVVLQYKPAKDLKYIPVTDKGLRGSTLQRLLLTSVQIKETVSVENIGKYVDYSKPEEGATPFFGFELAGPFISENGEFYEIGPGKLSEVNFHKSNAFGLTDLRLEGKCGPQRRCAFWISINQNVATVYQLGDASAVYEQDLDSDGIKEVIVLTYGQEVYIYKHINGQIQSVHVREALKTDNYRDTVTYNPDTQLFQLKNGNKTKEYQYAIGMDMLSQIPE